MNARNKWSRALFMVGFVLMVGGVVDPLEGSIVILLGSASLAIGALLTNSGHRTAVYWSFLLVAVGIGAMWVMSAIGGIGGNAGRSLWWALVLLPYPVGWLWGLIFGARRLLREGFV